MWDQEFESGFLQRRVRKLSVPDQRYLTSPPWLSLQTRRWPCRGTDGSKTVVMASINKKPSGS
jgi:hypothetical protein